MQVPPFSPFNVLFVERSLFTEAKSVDTSKEYLARGTFDTPLTLYASLTVICDGVGVDTKNTSSVQYDIVCSVVSGEHTGKTRTYMKKE